MATLEVQSPAAVTHARQALPREHRQVLTAFRTRLAGQDVPPFELQLADGSVHSFGVPGGQAAAAGGVASDPRFRIRIRSAEGAQALASFDEARIADAYFREGFDIDGDFLAAFDLRRFFSDHHPVWSAWRFLVPLVRGQISSDKRWVPRHYDYGNEFYFAFLDKKVRLYSQALFRSESETLEQAALNKLEYIQDICRLQAGSRVLDVGGGWGSWASYAAARGIDVTMLTIAHRQFDYVRELAQAADYPGRLEVVFESIYAYQTVERYDAIVLLGVMEHLPDYDALMKRFARLLKPNGRVYMDFSAVRRKYGISTVAYRYVFPGNHTPVFLPELLAAASRNPFEPIVVHNDRHSYFLTLQAWARNLQASRSSLAALVGESTVRLFEIYLWATAHTLGANADLESYRVVFQKSVGQPSSEIGLEGAAE
jgi:cyclopropane-fatty-acyl-phospholipid synthase